MSASPPFAPPVVLEGRRVRLEPLAEAHGPALAAAAADGELWRLWYTSVPTPEGMAPEIRRRLELCAQGLMTPFAALDLARGEPVGMTTFMNIDASNRRLEIGSTWYAKSVQGAGLNTESKLLLLTHAFEALDCLAVEFRTHFLNRQSRRAIEGLGAKLDGILRSHQVARDGSVRDTCVYSIIRSEWPAVRAHLAFRLEAWQGPRGV